MLHRECESAAIIDLNRLGNVTTELQIWCVWSGLVKLQCDGERKQGFIQQAAAN